MGLPNWRNTWQPASFQFSADDETLVACGLCPRQCRIARDACGFCGVRGNKEGRLVTFNFGKSVHLTEEVIETEAVNHFAPGAAILSLGNVGCNLRCVYCQNWQTSQVDCLQDCDVYNYTPEQVIETALRRGIRVLSWTYNDPVVWHEFVVETAAKAKDAGLFNLFKSAFFISQRAVEELLPYIDIFSISIKSLDPAYYRRMTSGVLEPILDATMQVFQAGRHVEISNLMITDISDDEASGRKVAEWVLNKLSPSVPLHYVSFHPDFRMEGQTTRTSLQRLQRAREAALEMGVNHVYLGNVFDAQATSSFCMKCHALLVTRFGLTSQIVGLDAAGHCSSCHCDNHFVLNCANERRVEMLAELPSTVNHKYEYTWTDCASGIHVVLANTSQKKIDAYYRRKTASGWEPQWRVVDLSETESYRFALSRKELGEVSVMFAFPKAVRITVHDLLDRAYFPSDSARDVQ